MPKRKALRKPADRWASLPWKTVDITKENLGTFDDSVFFGLEEIDASAYELKKDSVGISVVNKTAHNTDVVVGSTDIEESTSDPKKSGKEKKRKREKPSKPLKENKGPVAVESADKPQKKKKQKKSPAIEPEADKKVSSTATSEKSMGKTPVPAVPSSQIGLDVVDYIANQAGDAWGRVQLNSLLSTSLTKMGFGTPTPIQSAAIPLTLQGGCDIVGAAETGSGKTMSFGLPIINALLQQWQAYSNSRVPFALIIAPTRELAMQISTVMRDVSTHCMKQAKASFAEANKRKLSSISENNLRVEIVTIVGGMSEHKQRRQLSNDNKKPVHIIVATPGRLLDIFDDETIAIFQDMSALRFLVVDEADRIMEEGHFAELHRVFQRIRDHEDIRERGELPTEVARAKKMGSSTYDDGFTPSAEEVEMAGRQKLQRAERALELGDLKARIELAASDDELDEENFDLEDPEIEFEPMPSAEALAAAKEDQTYLQDAKKQVKLWEGSGPMEADEDVDAGDRNELSTSHPIVPFKRVRQTLLFSATAIDAQYSKQTSKPGKHAKKYKLQGTLKGIGENGALPDNLKQLLSIVATQGTIHVVDVTGGRCPTKIAADTSISAAAATLEGSALNEEDMGGVGLMPKNLSHMELRIPAEDKDAYLYYYLHKFPGRVLLFVNSIKTARRVDGLLRALELPSRTIHAQLQQRQRLRALEGFQTAPVGILVATDVAARGLDVTNIQTVIHYDVARTPQVYVHRSGRTARANRGGTAVSLVAPEDAAHHQLICEHIKITPTNTMPSLKVDLSVLPALRERVKLAKEIFTKSFVVSQANSEKQWVEKSAEEMGLQIDDYMQEELGNKKDQQKKEQTAKSKIVKARAQLKSMLDTSLQNSKSMEKLVPTRVKPGKKPRMVTQAQLNRRRGGLVVFAK